MPHDEQNFMPAARACTAPSTGGGLIIGVSAGYGTAIAAGAAGVICTRAKLLEARRHIGHGHEARGQYRMHAQIEMHGIYVP